MECKRDIKDTLAVDIKKKRIYINSKVNKYMMQKYYKLVDDITIKQNKELKLQLWMVYDNNKNFQFYIKGIIEKEERMRYNNNNKKRYNFILSLYILYR